MQIYFTKLRMNIKGNKTKFIDFYLRFRIGTLFHASNVILQELYCVRARVTCDVVKNILNQLTIEQTNKNRIKYKPKPTEQLYTLKGLKFK